MNTRLRALLPGFGLRGVRTARRIHAWAAGARAARRAPVTSPPPARGLTILRDTTFQQALPWLGISTALARALTLRGHQVTSIRCEGFLAQCEHTLGRQRQPSCALCSRGMRAAEEATGLHALGATSLLTAEDRASALAAAALPANDRLGLMDEGLPLGRLAARELQRFARGWVGEPASDPHFADWLESAAVLSALMDRALTATAPDLVLAANGRTLPSAILTARARQRGIRVVTWDTEPTHPDGLVFSHGGEAVVVPLDDAWTAHRGQPLDADQRDTLHAFARRWSAAHHPAAGQVPAGLREGAPLVLACSNSAWDMAAVDRDVAFRSMFDWLDTVVAAARRHPGVDVVIRAHPAERAGTPDLWSRTPVAATLRGRHRQLPANLHLVDASASIDTYALVDRARAVMVYSSRIGLEAALRGRRPWIAGATTFRGKGFSRDVEGPGDIEAAFTDQDAGRLTRDEQDLAERFAYLWWFRALVRIPGLRDGHRVMPVPGDAWLAPGGDPVIDRLCEAVVTGSPFLDLNRPISWSPRTP